MHDRIGNDPGVCDIERTDDQWAGLLDPRMKPFTDTIDQATNMERARSEYRFETQAAANQGLGSAFLQQLTGGKTGAEAEAFLGGESPGNWSANSMRSMPTI